MFRVIPWCDICNKKVDSFERYDFNESTSMIDAECHGDKSNHYLSTLDPLPDLSKFVLFPKKPLAPDSES